MKHLLSILLAARQVSLRCFILSKGCHDVKPRIKGGNNLQETLPISAAGCNNSAYKGNHYVYGTYQPCTQAL